MSSRKSVRRSESHDSHADDGLFDRRQYARGESRQASFGWRDALPAGSLKASEAATLSTQYEFDQSINSSSRLTFANCQLPPSMADLNPARPPAGSSAEIDFQAQFSEQHSVLSYDASSGGWDAAVSKTDSAWSWQQSLSSAPITPGESMRFSSQSSYSTQTESWSMNMPQTGAEVVAAGATAELVAQQLSVSSQFEQASQQFSYALNAQGSTIDYAAAYTSQKMQILENVGAGLECAEPVSETAELLPAQENRFTMAFESKTNTYQFNLQSDLFETSLAVCNSQSVTSWQASQPLPTQSAPTLSGPCDGFRSLDFPSVSRTETLSLTKGCESRIDLNFQAFSQTQLTDFAAPGDFGQQVNASLQQNMQLGLAAFG